MTLKYGLEVVTSKPYFKVTVLFIDYSSRSSKVVPSKSLGAISYSLSIVTMVVSVTVSEIFENMYSPHNSDSVVVVSGMHSGLRSAIVIAVVIK